MGDDKAKLIEAWFSNHDGDGEFAYHPRMPYLVYGPTGDVGRVGFTTKSHPVSLAITECAKCAGLGLIARYGLPSDTDVHWIADFVTNHELCFLGDMDPADLMIFAWLRARLHPKPIAFLGVSDAYLASLQVSVPEAYILKCAPSEQQALPLLDGVFPDFRETVGPKCSLLLEQGRKIELEAVLTSTTDSERFWQCSICGTKGSKL